MEMLYYGGNSPHYSVDRLEATTGNLLFSCDGGYGRIFINAVDDCQVVSSSVMLGAIANGDSLNLKPYLVGEIINKFVGYDPYTPVNDISPGTIHNRAYPNPFSQNVNIVFTNSKAERISVEILDASLRLVNCLTDDEMQPGRHVLTWDATNISNDMVPDGVYFYRIITETEQATGKLILIR